MSIYRETKRALLSSENGLLFFSAMMGITFYHGLATKSFIHLASSACSAWVCLVCLSVIRDERSWLEMRRDGDYENIRDLMALGHTEHCAMRQTWGDGECECGRWPQ